MATGNPNSLAAWMASLFRGNRNSADHGNSVDAENFGRFMEEAGPAFPARAFSKRAWPFPFHRKGRNLLGLVPPLDFGVIPAVDPQSPDRFHYLGEDRITEISLQVAHFLVFRRIHISPQAYHIFWRAR